jgi:hypothetical protein
LLLSYSFGGNGIGTSFGYFLKNLALMGGITFDRFDQIRNQVISSFELDINIRPCFLGPIFKANQAIK